MFRFTTIKKGLLCGLFFMATALSAQEGMKMKDIFVSMPENLLPLMTKNNKLDCIDYIENNMKAYVHNRLDDIVELEAMTDDYLRLRTSTCSTLEMKLLQGADSSRVICCVTTVMLGDSLLPVYDSQIGFYTLQWQFLPTSDYFTAPRIEDFVKEYPAKEKNDVEHAIQSLKAYHPLHIQLSEKEATLIELQINVLSEEDKKALKPYLKRIEGQVLG